MTTQAAQSLGEYLRGERERRNITIEQIASATKINIKLLHALESDSFDSLPAKPFVRGFITNYARYIGLEPQAIIAQYDLYLDQKTGQKFKRPADAPHIFVERESSKDHSKTMLTVVMTSFLVVGALAVAIFKPSFKSHHGHRGNRTAKLNNSEMYTVPLPPGEGSAVQAPEAASQNHSSNANTAAAQQATASKSSPTPAHVAQAPTPAGPTPSTAPVAAPKFVAPAQPIILIRPNAKYKAPVVAAAVTPTSTHAPAAQSTTPPTTAVAAHAPVTAAATPATPAPAKATAAAPATSKVPTPAAPPVAHAATPTSATPSTAATNPAPLPSAKASPPPIPNEEVKQRLVIRAKEDSWVKYQSDDRPLMGFILKKDKTIYVRARQNIRFMTGNPKGVEISVNSGPFQSFKENTRSIILPKEAEAEFSEKPFRE